jgi:hypothetical protein
MITTQSIYSCEIRLLNWSKILVICGKVLTISYWKKALKSMAIFWVNVNSFLMNYIKTSLTSTNKLPKTVKMYAVFNEVCYEDCLKRIAWTMIDLDYRGKNSSLKMIYFYIIECNSNLSVHSMHFWWWRNTFKLFFEYLKEGKNDAFNEANLLSWQF